MPNLNPVPDSMEHLQEQLDLISRDAVIDVFPYASITVGQKGEALSEMEKMAGKAIAFSDDGRGVQSEEMMIAAMKKAKELDRMIVAHCEVNDLLFGGYIHQGEYAALHGHRGICSASEYEQIRRDLRLAAQIGCRYHVCHISTAESVALIREAKRAGVDVSCETAPHYLVLDDSFLKEDGRFKMNPPLRSPRDREALVEGVLDGTIDMIATDHAPHSAEEKAKGLAGSAFGIVGLETAAAVFYTHLVRTGFVSLERMADLFCHNPRSRFRIPWKNEYSFWDLECAKAVDPAEFLSQGKATPFEGEILYGECLATVKNGAIVYKKR
jgi:dihydroorotase